MAQSSHSLFQRIRSVKSSLDKAEQSFMDNKDIRGELDLMLAEAELKNLRRKKDGSWSWNRHVLACCAAMLLAVAGFGGWYVAKDFYKPAAAAVPTASALNVQKATERIQEVSAPIIKDTPAPKAQAVAKESRVHISQADMRRLVQSAKVELSNSK